MIVANILNRSLLFHLLFDIFAVWKNLLFPFICLFFYISVGTWIPILFNEIIIYTIIIYFGAKIVTVLASGNPVQSGFFVPLTCSCLYLSSPLLTDTARCSRFVLYFSAPALELDVSLSALVLFSGK